MIRGLFLFGVTLLLLISCQYPVSENQNPLALHPQNPNYFIFKGKPTILVTSAEHYGAVMNDQFDFEKYLQTLSTE